MSCKLFASGSGDAPQTAPMPWNGASSQAARIDPRNLFAPAPKAAEIASQEELKAKLAAMEQRVREAREAGRAEGEAQGRRAVQAEVDGMLQKLAAAIHEASELRSRLRDEAEADLVRLAIAIARKIVGRELNADPETITGLVKAALEKVRTNEVLRVRVHPEHSARIGECLNRYGAAHAEVIADATADRGAAIFETTRGNFDASVETQLREIERGLADRFKGPAR